MIHLGRQLPPAIAPLAGRGGGVKILPKNLKTNYICRNFKKSERIKLKCSPFLFDYISYFSAPGPPTPHNISNTILIYLI